MKQKNNSSTQLQSQTIISNSNFLAYHTPLRTTTDFVNALLNVDLICRDLSLYLDQEVIAYSPFYLYYEVYLHLINQAKILAIFALIVVLLFSLIMTAFDFYLSFVLTLCVSMMIVSNLGMMFLLSIKFNPVSMINLLMLIGINVEFLSHFVVKFQKQNMESNNSLDASMKTLVMIGPSIVSGITMTKLIGVSLLSLCQAMIFKVYYFEMYMVAILIAFLHAFVVLPVIMCYYPGGTIESDRSFSLLDDD